MIRFMNIKYLIFGILVLALGLRIVGLNQSFWLDEATSALTVRNLSYTQIINDFSSGDFHPPLYYLTLKFWNGVFGNSEITLRSLSIVFGLASVYLTYLVGSIFGNKVGLLSALFLAVNGLHIYYSQEARMYSMSVFLVLVLIYLFAKTLTSKKLIYWILFSIVLALNAFTDYLPSLIIIVFWIYAIFTRRNNSWWKTFVVAHIPHILVTIFWIPFLLKQIQLGLSVRDAGSLWWKVLGHTDIKSILLVPVKFVFGRISFYNKIIYFGLSAFVLSVYYLIINQGYNRKLISNKFYLLIILWLLVPAILSSVVGFKISVFSYFRLIFVLPALFIILSLSILNLPKKWQKVSLAFVLSVSILSSLYYLITPRFHREDWKNLVSYIQNESKNSNYRVVFASNGQEEGFRYYSKSEDVIVKSNEIGLGLDKLWYVRYVQDIFDPDDSVKGIIESLGYKKKKTYDFNGIIVWEYENSN